MNSSLRNEPSESTFSGGVNNAEDMHYVPLHAIHNDVRERGHNELACSGCSSRPSSLRHCFQ